MFSSDTKSEFEEFCHCFLDYTRESVQSRQRGIEVSVTEALDSLKDIFRLRNLSLKRGYPMNNGKLTPRVSLFAFLLFPALPL